MRISLRPISLFRAAIDSIEPFAWHCFFVCTALCLLQTAAMAFLYPFVDLNLWLITAGQYAALFTLFAMFRKRRSLVWLSSRRIRIFKEPDFFDVSKFAKSTLRFKTLPALFAAWLATAILFYPFYARDGSGILTISRALINGSDLALFPTLWQVQATVLGVFLVILTFIFQFVSLRKAYETSLLPFLAERARIKEIILFNFFFVLAEVLPLLKPSNATLLMLVKYFAILGFFFSVLSAVYMLLRVLDLLRPDMIEENLTELVKRDLQAELQQEQSWEIAAALFEQACSASGANYSHLDLFRRMPAIRSEKTGRIVDIDIKQLTRFCSNLVGTLPSTNSPKTKASIAVMLGDHLTKQRNVLARVSLVDRTASNERMLRRAFRVEEPS